MIRTTRRFRSFRMVTCVVVGLMLLAGCDWSQLGYGPANTSDNGFEPAITTTSVAHLAVAWSQPCTCSGRTLVAGGVAYAVDATDVTSIKVRAFDAVLGTPKWSTPVAGAAVMAVSNGLVYVISSNQSLVALDAGTGSTRWTLHPPVPGTGTVSHLLVDGSEAFVDGTSALANANPVSEISAVDPAGHVIWSMTPGGRVAGFASVAGSTEPDSTARTLQVVSSLPVTDFGTPLITQYDETSGTLLHAALSPASPPAAFSRLADVSASGGLVYFTEPGVQGFGAGLFAVDPTTGAVVWSGFGNQSYALHPNVVVSVAQNHGIDATEGLDSRTGHLLWGLVSTGTEPVIVGGVVLSTDGSLQARDLTSGAVVGSFTPDNDTLSGKVTAANGLIYVGGATTLYALTPPAPS